MKNFAKNIIILLFSFWVVLINSQNKGKKSQSATVVGYKININTENLKGKTIKISFYKGNSKQVTRIDSTEIKSDEQTVVFSQTKKIIPVMYQLAITGAPEKVNILINNGSQLNFSLKSDRISALETSDALNKAFLESQKMTNLQERNLFLEQLQKQYPQHSALKYFTLFELRKKSQKQDGETVADFRKNLLKDIDLKDKSIALLPNTYPFLNNYFGGFDVTNENYKAGIDSFLKNQNCDSPNFIFYTDWILKNLAYLQNGNKNLNETYAYLFNTYINNAFCIENHRSFYDTALQKYTSLTKIPVGSTLPDFEMENIDKSLFKFSEYKKEQVNLIAFYDPLCVHCIKEMPEIAKTIESIEKQFNKKVSKIAVLNTSSKEGWKTFSDTNGLQDWVNVTYKKEDFTTQETLDAFQNPTFYIVDENGKILTKTFNENMIRNHLQ